jgi:UDP-sugar transporter A1/2/3
LNFQPSFPCPHPRVTPVVQNNLQYVAVSNLEAATFQVTYQMKILTTAAFSVLLLRKRLTPSQWLALLCLAVGVGIVQIQAGAGTSTRTVADVRIMHPLKGFMAVTAACFTSGLAGVYFEMVLKNTQADLWVRNVQLSLFSLLPAAAPIIFSHASSHSFDSSGASLMSKLFNNFGIWAWATVGIQVLGGLVTAMVIKYSDNILKGFATSLSIVISFLASVLLFSFRISFTFILGSGVVLIATWLYNQAPRLPGGGKDSLSLSMNLGETGRVVPVRSPTQEFTSCAISRNISTSSLASHTTLFDMEMDLKGCRTHGS